MFKSNEKAIIEKIFRPCRVSNPRPLHQGANSLPLSYQEQSYKTRGSVTFYFLRSVCVIRA